VKDIARVLIRKTGIVFLLHNARCGSEERHMSSKPTGIVILAILQLLEALVALAIGALALIAGALLLPIFGLLLAFFPLLIGIIGLILFYGLWTLKGWAWLWTLIINILSIILGLLGNLADMTNLLSIAISVIIVIYLFMPNVRAAFKK
jgi:hypothetical protein